MGQEEYQYLSRFLNRFTRRFKLLRAIEGVCLTAICALVLLALGPGIAELRNIFPYAPLVYSILTGAVLLAAIGWTVFHFLRRFSPETAALYIEQKQPKLRNNLINSLQLYPQVVEQRGTTGASASMILALLRVTRKQIADLQITDLLDTQRLKSGLRLLGFVALPVLAMVLLNPSWVSGTFGMLTDPLAHLPPTKTSIEIEPRNARLVRGAPLTIEAVTTGALPQSLQLITWTGANQSV